MELARFTLADYIKYFGGSESSAVDTALIRFVAPVCVSRDSVFREKLQNMWVIGIHIALGLEFMHSHDHVHRDLKPSNGVHSLINADISALLLRRQ